MTTTKSASKSRSTSIALAMALSGSTALAAACSSSDPPIATGDTPHLDAAVADSGGVIFDAAQYLDGSDGSVTEGGSDGASDSVAPIDSTLPDTATGDDDSGKVDVASLPDVASLDSSVPCGFLSCSPGCCNAAGGCVGGGDDTVCGNSGNACQDCTTSGRTCQSFTCYP